MAKKLTNKQKGYLAGAGALGLFLLYGGGAKAKTKGPTSTGGGTTGGGTTGGSTTGGGTTGGGTTGGGSTTSTTLKKGSSGKAVKEWQRKIAFVVTEKDPFIFPLIWTNPETDEDLYEWGSDWKSSDDGKFGSTTKGMTRLFQGHNGLTADGIAGKKTQAKMSQIIASTGTSEKEIESTPLASVPGSYP
jgi:peptidoglycan hydrolase-like protein with peptidoglycan-binding domain